MGEIGVPPWDRTGRKGTLRSVLRTKNDGPCKEAGRAVPPVGSLQTSEICTREIN